MQEYTTYSLPEKRAFIIGALSELKAENAQMSELHHYFVLNDNITEEECDEIYAAITQA